MRRLFIVLALAGCATTSRGPDSRTVAEARTPSHEPRCSTATTLLAVAAHKPQGGILALGSDGFAVIWAEQAQRSTLRFVIVDRNGQARGTSVEVVDAPTAIVPLDVHLDGANGYIVAWSESGEPRSRALDPRGRPRGDVEKLAAAPSPSSAPADAPTISMGAEGLKLASQVCVKE